jgi:hypothetical protein
MLRIDAFGQTAAAVDPLDFCMRPASTIHTRPQDTPQPVNEDLPMTAASSYTVTERPLESLGISAAEECTYVALLDHPEATLVELASALAWSPRKVQRLLDALQGMGLVTFAAGEPRRFVPASPDIAIEAILSRREDELRRARAEIQRLQQRATEGAGTRQQMIELITTHEAERHVF